MYTIISLLTFICPFVKIFECEKYFKVDKEVFVDGARILPLDDKKLDLLLFKLRHGRVPIKIYNALMKILRENNMTSHSNAVPSAQESPKIRLIDPPATKQDGNNKNNNNNNNNNNNSNNTNNKNSNNKTNSIANETSENNDNMLHWTEFKDVFIEKNLTDEYVNMDYGKEGDFLDSLFRAVHDSKVSEKANSRSLREQKLRYSMLKQRQQQHLQQQQLQLLQQQLQQQQQYHNRWFIEEDFLRPHPTPTAPTELLLSPPLSPPSSSSPLLEMMKNDSAKTGDVQDDDEDDDDDMSDEDEYYYDPRELLGPIGKPPPLLLSSSSSSSLSSSVNGDGKEKMMMTMMKMKKKKRIKNIRRLPSNDHQLVDEDILKEQERLDNETLAFMLKMKKIELEENQQQLQQQQQPQQLQRPHQPQLQLALIKDTKQFFNRGLSYAAIIVLLAFLATNILAIVLANFVSKKENTGNYIKYICTFATFALILYFIYEMFTLK
ncbi:hypothetical protein HELRODRAFT_193368 [Helobdella robusta]|uniref:Uncharacterized protein n=1 Tax=Helobdella robusta TaxID=6412 RepID=T1FUX4_HELRO|nr:hypothetical protein HELRODRAFT_193368 [Helobdella robusta]ESN97129.1 hypothetical protein HELRODRAFT_193368 [Helobdella robusta]